MSEHFYTVTISDDDIMMFACETNDAVRKFAMQFDGCEYESEFDRIYYLAGTDVFVEATGKDGELFLIVKNWDDEEYWRIHIDEEILHRLTTDEDGNGMYLVLSPRYIAGSELQNAFAGRQPQEFGREITKLESKYDCKDSIICYIVCFFTQKGKDGMKGEFGISNSYL